MTYEGNLLLQCPAEIDFSNTSAVVVSGAKWNPCGHMVFCCGTNSNDSWYFHVAGQGVKEAVGFWAYPKFMRGDEDYNLYLAANGKREIRRLNARITNPSGAYNKLMNVMSQKWFWGVLANNCAVFAREIITAGGGSVEVLLNCPDQEFVGKVEKALDETLESYVVPYGIGI